VDTDVDCAGGELVDGAGEDMDKGQRKKEPNGKEKGEKGKRRSPPWSDGNAKTM
jgi:hypothetical protein